MCSKVGAFSGCVDMFQGSAPDTQVCSKATIGDDCFIGHSVMFINDRFRDGRIQIPNLANPA